jgi:hypothetical protein
MCSLGKILTLMTYRLQECLEKTAICHNHPPPQEGDFAALFTL